MSRLTPEQTAEIEGFFREDEVPFNLRLGYAVLGHEEIEHVEREIREEMAAEGKHLPDRPEVASIWGGEFAARKAAAMRDGINAHLSRVKSELTQTVCPEFCRIKQSGTLEDEGVKIAIAVADGLISAAVAFPAPVTRLSVYIVKNRLLDRWCDCTKA